MSLPRHVKVDGKTYRIVSMDRRRAKAKNLVGWCDFEKRQIEIFLDRQHDSDLADTMLHELLHACWEAEGIGKRPAEERAVTGLAKRLTQVIRDNPQVFDWISQKARS